MKPKKSKRTDEATDNYQTLANNIRNDFCHLLVGHLRLRRDRLSLSFGIRIIRDIRNQITFALYPFAYFVLAFLLLPHHQNRLKRWFMAIFISLIGMMTWMVVSMIINRLWPSLMYWSEKGTGIWDTFGGEWLQMIAAGMLFTILLLFAQERRCSLWLISVPLLQRLTPGLTGYQMEQVVGFATRLHIDVSDGEFTPNKLIDLEYVWWPGGLRPISMSCIDGRWSIWKFCLGCIRSWSLSMPKPKEISSVLQKSCTTMASRPAWPCCRRRRSRLSRHRLNLSTMS